MIKKTRVEAALKEYKEKAQKLEDFSREHEHKVFELGQIEEAIKNLHLQKDTIQKEVLAIESAIDNLLTNANPRPTIKTRPKLEAKLTVRRHYTLKQLQTLGPSKPTDIAHAYISPDNTYHDNKVKQTFRVLKDLKNLQLVTKKGRLYEITEKGMEYLKNNSV